MMKHCEQRQGKLSSNLPSVADNIAEEAGMESTKTFKLFLSYSHEDEKLLKRLIEHLGLMKRQGVIEDWHDGKIKAGEDWEKAVWEHFNQADIILLLISASF